MIHNIRNSVKKLQPLIHCITNPISINQCANAILAVGARPIMAEHPGEVAEITKTAKALLLNLGNITDVRMESMLLSVKTAKEHKIPIVLDVVGIACSKLRRDFACELILEASPTVIKGNYSEIYALYNIEYQSSGVDADTSLSVDFMGKLAVELARKNHTIILASGKTDIITDGKQIVWIHNGSPKLSMVTGTGCMLGALCACYLAVNQEICAVVTACVILGISGELSETEKGLGSFFINLMDKISTVTEKEIEKYSCYKMMNVANSYEETADLKQISYFGGNKN